MSTILILGWWRISKGSYYWWRHGTSFSLLFKKSWKMRMFLIPQFLMSFIFTFTFISSKEASTFSIALEVCGVCVRVCVRVCVSACVVCLWAKSSQKLICQRSEDEVKTLIGQNKNIFFPFPNNVPQYSSALKVNIQKILKQNMT